MDNKAKEFCDAQGVEWLDIIDLLRLSLLKASYKKEDVLEIINEIEERDRTRIKRKDEIFG